jgi:hypothetical protein
MITLFSETWFGSALGIIGIALAYLFYRKSRSVSKLSFQFDSTSIVGFSDSKFPDQLKISYNNEEIPRVTKERFVFWNSGNITVSGSQIVASDPFRIELCGDGKILSAIISKVSREVNGVACSISETDPKKVVVIYDFLDPNDGFIVEIIHSGNENESKICGTLRSLPEGIKSRGRANFSNGRTKKDYAYYSILTVSILMVIIGLFRPELSKVFPRFYTSKPQDPSTISWITVGMGFLYIILPTVIMWSKRRVYPAKLELFESNKEKEPNQ